MFDVFYSGVKPGLFVHEREARDIEHARLQSRTRYFWWVNYLSDYTGWDFLWEPVPWEQQFTHAWPSQHHDYSGTYLVPANVDTIEYKFHTEIIPNRCTQQNYHVVVSGADFDFTWQPHPFDPPYIYVFGNQWWPATKMPTVEYHVPGAVERKYMNIAARLPEQHTNHWHTLIDCVWDYSWVPDPGDPPYIYVFGNQWHRAEVMPTVEYHVPGATERKYLPWPRAELLSDQTLWNVSADIDPATVDYTWSPDPGSPPYIYQFGTQHQRTGGPRYVMPGATEVKYVGFFRTVKLDNDNLWEIPEGADVETFDWTWHPDATDSPYIYQFGTQHQRTGGPRYVMPGATEVKYVDQLKIVTKSIATAVYEIDHLDGNAGQIPDTYKISRYFDNYLDTLTRIAKSVPYEHEFVWICSSVCDYTNFDFTWHPEQWQATMLHVFPSNGEKFGDTFFMHVPTFLYRSEKCQLLEWYDLNFTDISVPRRPMPMIKHLYDSQATAVSLLEFRGPLAIFTTKDIATDQIPVVPLWREKTKTVVPLSAGATSVIVPRAAVPYIKTQLYDYPYIDKTHRILKDDALDIVFISNGEGNADQNWNYLENRIVNLEENRLVRVDGVKGRVASYHAAAEASTTEWFFAVFAKLQISIEFDWSWQPDRMQEPKHYIFHAKNSINGLVYGHQAMIAYNKKLVLSNPGVGLDFTLDSPHEVVPILSGTANYAYSDWMCWRTAFREVLKLKSALPDIEAEYRLRTWLTPTPVGLAYGISPVTAAWKWSAIGAEDAVEYYDEVGGDFDALKKSYDWAWLSSYAFMKHSLLPDQ